MKKYVLTNETKEFGNVTVTRIRALIDIPCYNVKAGDLGGYVQHIMNLSEVGNSWIADDAVVLDKAVISGDAYISDNAIIYGSAVVTERAQVSDRSMVFGFAKIYGDASICDYAEISGSVKISGNVCIYDHGKVYGWATLTHNVSVSGCARISGHVVLSDDVEICDNVEIFENAVVLNKTIITGNCKIGRHAYIKNSHDLVLVQAIGNDIIPFTFYKTINGDIHMNHSNNHNSISIFTFEEYIKTLSDDLKNKYELMIKLIKIQLS